jgi:uncharacterized RDD family membrane protein YckC
MAYNLSMQPYESSFSSTESSIFPERPAVYATFWERFAAVLVDSLIIGVPNWLITHYIIVNPVGNLIFGTIVGWLYNALMMSGPNQATFGKKAMGIKVTDTKGHRISFARATGRYFAQYISGIILGIGYLMMLWDDRKQTLHDKIADTLVVKQAPYVMP